MIFKLINIVREKKVFLNNLQNVMSPLSYDDRERLEGKNSSSLYIGSNEMLSSMIMKNLLWVFHNVFFIPCFSYLFSSINKNRIIRFGLATSLVVINVHWG